MKAQSISIVDLVGKPIATYDATNANSHEKVSINVKIDRRSSVEEFANYMAQLYGAEAKDGTARAEDCGQRAIRENLGQLPGIEKDYHIRTDNQLFLFTIGGNMHRQLFRNAYSVVQYEATNDQTGILVRALEKIIAD